MAKIKAALLDENGVYLRIDELAGPHKLTPRHLPQITECDLPPGRYKWIPSKTVDANEWIRATHPEMAQHIRPRMQPAEFGGAFHPIDHLKN